MSENMLTSMFEPFVIMEVLSRAADDEGGEKITLSEGDEISAFAKLDSTPERSRAQRDEENDRYTVTTDENVFLDYGQVIKRLRDGKCFYLTSGNREYKLPDIATIRIRCCTAEEYEIP